MRVDMRPEQVTDKKSQHEEENWIQEKSGHCGKILVSFSVFPRLGSVDKLTFRQIGPLPPRITLALSQLALPPDDRVDVPVDDLRVLVLEVALVVCVIHDLQLQASAPAPLRGDVLGGLDRHFPLEEDGREKLAGFSESGVVGRHGCRGDEPFVFVLEEDGSSGGLVVGAASSQHGWVFHVGGLRRHVVDSGTRGWTSWSWSCCLAGSDSDLMRSCKRYRMRMRNRKGAAAQLFICHSGGLR